MEKGKPQDVWGFSSLLTHQIFNTILYANCNLFFSHTYTSIYMQSFNRFRHNHLRAHS